MYFGSYLQSMVADLGCFGPLTVQYIMITVPSTVDAGE